MVGRELKPNREIHTQEEHLNHAREFINIQWAGTFKE